MTNNGKLDFVIKKHRFETRLASYLIDSDSFDGQRILNVKEDLLSLKVFHFKFRRN